MYAASDETSETGRGNVTAQRPSEGQSGGSGGGPLPSMWLGLDHLSI